MLGISRASQIFESLVAWDLGIPSTNCLYPVHGEDSKVFTNSNTGMLRANEKLFNGTDEQLTLSDDLAPELSENGFLLLWEGRFPTNAEEYLLGKYDDADNYYQIRRRASGDGFSFQFYWRFGAQDRMFAYVNNELDDHKWCQFGLSFLGDDSDTFRFIKNGALITPDSATIVPASAIEVQATLNFGAATANFANVGIGKFLFAGFKSGGLLTTELQPIVEDLYGDFMTTKHFGQRSCNALVS